MKVKLIRPIYNIHPKCPNCKTIYEDTSVKTCTECRQSFLKWFMLKLGALIDRLSSVDWVGGFIIGLGIMFAIAMGFAIKIDGDKRTRLMKQCMEDGKREYICEHLLKDQTQTSYWFMNMGGR